MRTETEKDRAYAQGKNAFQIADEKRGSSRSDAARDAAFASGKNRFTLVNEARDRAMDPETETAPAPEKSHDELKAERRARFSGRDAEGRPVGQNRHLTSHVPLDAETEAARKAYHASRTTTEKPLQSEHRPVQYDAVTMSAVLLQWQRDHADYADTPWNGEQFSECLADHLIRGESFSYGLLNAIFAELTAGNHLEKKGPRMRDDFTSRSPQEYVRREVTPAEQAELDKQRQSAEEVQLHADRTMPLSQLAKKVRAGFRDLRTPDLRGTKV